MKRANTNNSDFVTVKGMQLHKSCVKKENGVTLIDSRFSTRLPLVPGETYFRSGFRPLDQEGNSWSREILKRAKYMLRSEMEIPEVKISISSYERFGDEIVTVYLQTGEKTIRNSGSYEYDHSSRFQDEDPETIGPWNTRVNFRDAIREKLEDKAAQAVLVAMIEVLTSRHKNNVVEFEWLDDIWDIFENRCKAILGEK